MRSRWARRADLALFKLDELRFSGHGDPLAALVLCGAHRADRVMVGGKWVVLDGAIPGLDVSDLIRRHSAARSAAGGVRFRSTEMLLRCAASTLTMKKGPGVAARTLISLGNARPYLPGILSSMPLT